MQLHTMHTMESSLPPPTSNLPQSLPLCRLQGREASSWLAHSGRQEPASSLKAGLLWTHRQRPWSSLQHDLLVATAEAGNTPVDLLLKKL